MKLLSMAISDIQEYVRSSALYFWGAGKIFNDYISKLAEYGTLFNVKGVVDKTQTGFRTIGEKKVSLISIEKFLQEFNKGDLLVITTIYYREILEILREYDKDDKIRVCIYNFTYLEQYDKVDFEKKFQFLLNIQKNK